MDMDFLIEEGIAGCSCSAWKVVRSSPILVPPEMFKLKADGHHASKHHSRILLNIGVPIIQAPIGSATCPELAAAVSNADGLGMLAPQ